MIYKKKPQPEMARAMYVAQWSLRCVKGGFVVDAPDLYWFFIARDFLRTAQSGSTFIVELNRFTWIPLSKGFLDQASFQDIVRSYQRVFG